MKCPECDATMTIRHEDWPYTESGLPEVVLHGVEVRRCPACGEVEVAIPRIEELHRLLAWKVATKTQRLTATEIRFVRKHLGWSGVDFAQHMGVTPETVSRWEKGHESMSATAERVLRLMVAVLQPTERYPIDLLANLEDTTAALKLVMHPEGKHWQAEAMSG